MELEPELPNIEDACPVCDNLACTCVPEDAEEGLAEWFRNLTFEDAWTLASVGNVEALNEVLRRQWEYNNQ
jgi:hypothetical protein